MRKYFFLLILLLAALLRFYQLGVNPPSLSWDEAAMGYNAFSIGNTLRSEYGRFLPLNYFASFGDYKPVLYVYTAVLPVKIFGLSEFAVRFPSAFFGVLTVAVTYFLVKELFPDNSPRSVALSHRPRSPAESAGHLGGVTPFSLLPLLASFLLAVSPWHINLSRAGFEANLALFFLLLGVWFFLKGGRFLLLAAISLVATFYTFNSCRVFVPLLLIGLAPFCQKKLLAAKKWAIAAVVLGGLLLLPLGPHLLSTEGRLRFKEVNIFSDLRPIETANQRIAVYQNAWWARIIHNRRVYFAFSFLSHYFDHFHPNFLFLYGDGNPKFSIRDVGQLYLWSLPFLLIGLFSLLREKTEVSLFLLFWLLVAPLPAATARETPHALRIENILPTFQIFTAFGVIVFYQWLKKQKKRFRYCLITAAAGLLIFNIAFYLHNLFFHYPWEFSGEWQYGYKEAIEYISQVKDNYEKVVFTTALGRPYIYFLFYEQYPPEKFWQNSQVEKEAMGFINVHAFDKYQFQRNLTEIDSNGQTLYVLTVQEVPDGVNRLKTFYLLNGRPILVAFDSR